MEHPIIAELSGRMQAFREAAELLRKSSARLEAARIAELLDAECVKYERTIEVVREFLPAVDHDSGKTARRRSHESPRAVEKREKGDRLIDMAVMVLRAAKKPLTVDLIAASCPRRVNRVSMNTELLRYSRQKLLVRRVGRGLYEPIAEGPSTAVAAKRDVARRAEPVAARPVRLPDGNGAPPPRPQLGRVPTTQVAVPGTNPPVVHQIAAKAGGGYTCQGACGKWMPAPADFLEIKRCA